MSVLGSGSKNDKIRLIRYRARTPRRPPTVAVLASGVAPGINGKHRELLRDEGERRAEHAAADVRGEALARAAQVHRIHVRQVVAPEAELGDGEEAGEENADPQQRDAHMCETRAASSCRNWQTRFRGRAQTPRTRAASTISPGTETFAAVAAAGKVGHEHRQREAAEQAARLLRLGVVGDDFLRRSRPAIALASASGFPAVASATFCLHRIECRARSAATAGSRRRPRHSCTRT